MNNWRLLLFAVVAVLQPIGSFTERYSINGHQECCKHGSDVRDPSLYGTFQKSVPEQLSSRLLTDRTDSRESRRYDTRNENSLIRRSAERGAVERLLTNREKFSRHQEGRRREIPKAINLKQSRINGVSRTDDYRYERTTSEPTRHVSIDARSSRSESTRDLTRDLRDAGFERKMKVIERMEIRLTEIRRNNNERDRTHQRENRAWNEERRATEERRNHQIRKVSNQNLRVTEDNGIMISDQRRDSRHSERITRERLADIRDGRDRQFSVLREQRERNFNQERFNSRTTVSRIIRSVQNRDDGRINERVEPRRDSKRVSDDRVESRLRESREQRLQPQRATSLSRNIRSIQSDDERRRINERVEQRLRESNRMSDDRVESWLREPREQRLEAQRAASVTRNMRSYQSDNERRINEKVEQTLRDSNSMSDARVESRLREFREQRLEPQRVTSLSRNIRSIQSDNERRINERVEQSQRGPNRMLDNRGEFSLRESREQRAMSQSRNIRSVQSRDEHSINERVEKRQRETSRVSDDRVASRLRESRQSTERRSEPQRAVRQLQNMRSEQSRSDDRVNEMVEQRRQRETNRMGEERLSRLRETRQSLENRLDRRSWSLSRTDDIRNRQEATRRPNNIIDERLVAREQNIRESRDNKVKSNRNSIRDISRISSSTELNNDNVRNSQRLQKSARRISEEREQDARRGSRIVRESNERNEDDRNHDFRSSHRDFTRDRRTIDERTDSQRRYEVSREKITHVSRNMESRIPSTLPNTQNERELKSRTVSSRNREISPESKRRESMDILLKPSEMVMERLDLARESRKRMHSNDVSRIRETLIHEKSEKNSGMNWQYLFYTLQGAYLCGLLIQLLTEQSVKSKNRNFSWWNPVSNKLIKVD